MNVDIYKVPAKAATAIVTEKKSEFIANIAKVATEEEALEFLATIRAKHAAARHNVYAYVLRVGARTRCSDDGEPAKTAGLPILSAIQHAGLFNCIIVVTRYFGGVLLGTGGLVRAYTAAASAAVQKAGYATVRPLCTLALSLPYALYEQIIRVLGSAGAKIIGEPVFEELVYIKTCLPEEDTQMLSAKLRDILRGDEGIAISPPYEDLFPLAEEDSC